MKSSESSTRQNYSLRNVVLALAVSVLSLAVLVYALTSQEGQAQSALVGLSSSVFTLGLISLSYDFMVRRSFVDLVGKVMRGVVEEMAPPSLDNMRRAGIVNAYEGLDLGGFGRDLAETVRSEIRISKMWIPEISFVGKALRKAVQENGCHARVLLLDPSCVEAIEKRAKSLDTMEAEDVRNEISRCYKELARIKGLLDDPSGLRIRLHQNFVSLSLLGIDRDFKVGFYWNGNLATSGPQIKVCGGGHFFLQAVEKHFESEWKNAAFEVAEDGSLERLEIKGGEK